MEIPIRSKDYSFPEAFNAVGKKLVPGWTGKEIEARKCHSPEDVEKKDTLPDRLLRVIDGMGNPSDLDAEGLQDLQNHIDGANHARLVRQSATWAQEIKDLKEDPEAYQERYDLWSRRCEAERPFNDIMHHDHADGWIITPEGNRLEIQPTHWHRRGPFIPPQLPGTCGEYKGEVGEVWINRIRLDHFLKNPSPRRSGPGRPPGTRPATRRKYKKWVEAAEALKTKHAPYWSMDQAMDEAADDMGIQRGTFKRRLFEQGLVKKE